MKVMQRGIMKIAPDKMEESIELNGKYVAVVRRLGMPLTALRCYGDECIHTVIFDVEWDSLATMATFFKNVMAEPEM